MGKRTSINIGDKTEMCVYKEQYSAARQQNVANSFPLLWNKPVSRHCVGGIIRKNNWRTKRVKM
jgi:hypothetical protein